MGIAEDFRTNIVRGFMTDKVAVINQLDEQVKSLTASTDQAGYSDVGTEFALAVILKDAVDALSVDLGLAIEKCNTIINSQPLITAPPAIVPPITE